MLDIVIVVVLLVSHLMPRNTTTELMNPTHPGVFFIGNGLAFATMVAGFVIAMRLLQGKRLVDILGQWRWRYVAIGFGLWTACLIVNTAADFILRPSGFRWTGGEATATLAIWALVGLGVQTFAEEFVFRGYLTQGLLLATKRPLVASILSGLCFGALHVPNGAAQCANAVLFGVVASLIAIRTGGIAFTWGLHLVNNLFAAVIVVSAGDVFKGSPGLISQATPNLMWWDAALGIGLLAVPVWFVMTRAAPRGTESPATP